MEADRFDQLIADKMGGIEPPAYSESKWLAFEKGLPSQPMILDWKVLSLVTMMVLSNAWWYSQSDQTVETNNSPVLENSLSPIQETVKEYVYISDTIYQTVEVERIVYVTIQPNPDQEVLLTEPKSNERAIDADVGTTTQNNDASIMTRDITPLLSDTDDTVNLEEDAGQEANPEKVLLADGEQDDQILEEEKAEEKRQKREHVPYNGPRWVIGGGLQLPLVTGSDYHEYKGIGYGAALEFKMNRYLSLMAELNLWSQSFSIIDPAYYDQVLNESETSPNDQGVYGQSIDGGVYGTDYTWQASDVSEKGTIQTGLFMLVTPFENVKYLPFISAGYLIDIRSNPEVNNRLLESGTDKIILVESHLPENTMSQFMRYGVGVETPINGKLSLKFSAEYWKQMTGLDYKDDLFGVRLVMLYHLDK